MVIFLNIISAYKVYRMKVPDPKRKHCEDGSQQGENGNARHLSPY
jgi:hypothetical protein